MRHMQEWRLIKIPFQRNTHSSRILRDHIRMHNWEMLDQGSRLRNYVTSSYSSQCIYERSLPSQCYNWGVVWSPPILHEHEVKLFHRLSLGEDAHSLESRLIDALESAAPSVLLAEIRNVEAENGEVCTRRFCIEAAANKMFCCSCQHHY